jgi:beta-fructofuranosidase
VDRTHSGFPHDILNVRDFQVHPDGGNLKLRIVMDRNSMELFLNDGEQAASFILYTPQEASSISFRAEGMAVIDVEKYDLVFEIRKTECFPGRRAPEGSTPTIV